MTILTSDTHPLRVDWLPSDSHELRGALGMTLAPGRNSTGFAGIWKRCLAKDLDRLHLHYGVNRIVSLIEDHELHSIGIPNLYGEIASRGMALTRLAIPDGGVPALEDLTELVILIIQAMQRGERVVLHCHAGLGRTGMVAAAVLAGIGMPAPQAISLVRKTRHSTIETREQAHRVYDIAHLPKQPLVRVPFPWEEEEEELQPDPREQLLTSFHTAISAHLAEEEFQAAQTLLRMALDLHPNDAELLTLQARLQLRAEEPALALATLNRVADLGTSPDSQFYELRASAHEALEHWEEAARDYATISLVNAQHEDLDSVYSNLGACLDHLRDFEGAIAAYTRAIELNPTMPPWYLNRSLTWMNMERWSEAAADCTAALDDHGFMDGGPFPFRCHVYSQRAVAWAGLGDWSSALVDWQALLADRPGDVEALVGLTLAYRQLGQSSQAEDCWQAVKAQLPLLGRRRWFAEQCLTRWQGPLEEAMQRLL